MRLIALATEAPGRWRGVTVYRGRKVKITVDGRTEELKAWRRVLPLLVPKGAIEALRQRTVEAEADAPEVRAS